MRYPADLPVVAHRGEILAALRSSNAVVVCGDTGSGKTTQLPKIALEAGCTRIACTQPRRLAAVTMAERVADELQSSVGRLVGYQHRFGRCLSDETRVKFMTDGVLLAETRGDPLLRRYDCIILDEAHERSLNVDFLLGILKRILERRDSLKVIVSSATLDVARFSAYFGNAPTVTVPGRLFPVETRYLPPPADEERDLARDVAAAVATLPPTGDILVFLPGERDIRDCAELLEGCGDDIIPLLASLPAGEQRRAFTPSARRRIVLATNVAETSVTIPGIRYVIDSGLARISRYVPRTRVQRLQVEPISQASARQRQGRCGRLGPGVCLRLYSEEDFLTREEFTPPEIQRTSLAGVILAMLDLGLGDIARFPFLDPPRSAAVTEGFRELIELGAVTRNASGEACLSFTGRRLARIPVEPRLARMLLAASDLATLPSALPVVAALSCDDPRRRPVDEREKAVQAHAAFRVAGSDFLGTLKLWTWYRDQADSLSQSKLRKLCTATYLSFPKMREWTELVRQLDRLVRRLGLDAEHDNGGPDALHRALLTGLLSNIGRYDPEERNYRGAHGLRFALHPSSVLTRRVKQEKPPPGHRPKPANPKAPVCPEWIMCGELVDTARLFAREVAAIDVGWIESAAGPLARRHCHSPEWDPASGYVRATEQVTLYGLVIVPARRCDFSRYDPARARDLFIRRGLIDGAILRAPEIVRSNSALLQELRRRAEKLRRADLFDEDALARHFDEVLPPDIASAPALIRWFRRAKPAELDRFRLRKSDWWGAAGQQEAADYPNLIRIGNAKLHLSYRNRPDDPRTDGLTCTVRRTDAPALALWRADWLVPGLLNLKLMWMLSVLPTAERRVLAPLEDTVAGLRAKLRPGQESLENAVVRTIREEWGFRISPEAWRRTRLPDHLRARFVIRDDSNGRPLADTRDLDAALAAVGLSAGSSSIGLDRSEGHAKEWVFGTIPETSKDGSTNCTLTHYPALRDEGDGVTLRLYADPEEAARAHAEGVLRLILIALSPKAKRPFSTRNLSIQSQLFLKSINYTSETLSTDILTGSARSAFLGGLSPVRSEEEFRRRLESRRGDFLSIQSEMMKLVADALNVGSELLAHVEGDESLAPETADSIQTQLLWLLAPGFPRTTPLESLRHYARYLKGVTVRLERARTNRLSDLSKERRFAPCWARYRAALALKGPRRPSPEALRRARWLLEEYRISIFAQELHTSEPVSEKRIDELLFSRSTSVMI